MPFLPGQEKPTHSGRKPGRPRGSVNIRNATARDIMEKLGVNPLEALLLLSRRKSTPLDLKIDCLKAATRYCFPVLATSEIKGFVAVNSETAVKIRAIVTGDPALADAAEKLAIALAIADDKIIDVTPNEQNILGPSDAERDR